MQASFDASDGMFLILRYFWDNKTNLLGLGGLSYIIIMQKAIQTLSL
jgi:hypothetical protein